MNILKQVDITSIFRAANTAHFEYLATVHRRTDNILLENKLLL